jgi:hypothetical protein
VQINFPGRPPTVGEKQERMQRMRVGLTGLAAVGLIVVIATAVATSVRKSASETAAIAGPPSVVATVPTGDNAAEKSEPLAQLGVTPDANKDAAVAPEKNPN